MTAVAAPTRPPSRQLLGSLGRAHGTIAAIVVFLVMAAMLQLTTGQGISYFDVTSITASATTLALAAIGETIVVLAGGLDLSAGAVISLVNVAIVTQLDATAMSPAAYTLSAAAIALGIGGAIGAVNGLLVAYLRLQSIIVTLATMFVAMGASLLILRYPGGEALYDFSLFFTGDAIAGVLPAPVLVLVVALAIWVLLKGSRLGTAIYAIGSDEAAAAANGVAVRRTRFLTFVIAGLFYGAAGLFITANMGAGDPTIGQPMLLRIFAAVVLGGTLIGGGRGGAVGTVFGALTLTIVINILLVLGLRTFYSPIVEGLILLLAVLGFSLGRSSPVTGIARYWSRTIQAARRGTLVRHVTTAPLAFGQAAAAMARPGWLTRNAATLRFVLPAYALLVVVFIATVAIYGTRFNLGGYVNSLLLFSAFLAVLGLGQGAVIISGGLDLSIAWCMVLPAIIVTTLAGGSDTGALWAVPLALGVGLAIGLVNGSVITLFGLSPIIVTLAMNGVLEGLSLWVSGGYPIGAVPPAIKWFVTSSLGGLAPVGWFLVVFAIGATLLLNRTAFGRRLFAIGNRPLVARLSGVRTSLPIIAAYMLSGFCSALTGLFVAGLAGNAFLGMGDPYLLSSIAVVVLGGTLITGGRGHYVGILGGALLFTALGTMLSGTTLPEAVRSIVYGLVLLGAVIALRDRNTG